LWDILVLDADLWLRKWVLWSTNFPVSGNGLSPTLSHPSPPFLCLFTDSLVVSLAPCPPSSSSALLA
jgi:hypothetical protein